MNRKVAIPIKDDKLSEYFGVCDYYEIVELAGIVTSKRSIENPIFSDITKVPSWLEKLGVNDVIAYKVEKEILSHFALKRINLFIGIPRKNSVLLIEDYCNGRLRSDEKIIEELLH